MHEPVDSQRKIAEEKELRESSLKQKPWWGKGEMII
jgi:hypothetical protein